MVSPDKANRYTRRPVARKESIFVRFVFKLRHGKETNEFNENWKYLNFHRFSNEPAPISYLSQQGL